MLQIYIHGEKESGFLELAPGTILEIESLQERFDEDIAQGEFSLPIDIAWTDTNRRLLNFSERVENFKRIENFWICTVYNNMFPEIIRAKFTILSKSGNFNYRKGSFSASISGTKGLYGSAIKNKKLADLELGGTITWETLDSRGFANAHANGDFPQYNYFTFVPVAISQFFDESRRDFNAEFLANDCVNNVIINGGSWTFGRPSPDNPATALASGNEGYEDYRTIPFFRAQYILKQCFNQFGFQVAGDFIDDVGFADMVVFNNYGIDNMNYYLHFDYNKKIVPSNHVPDTLISQWLKDLFSLTSTFPVFLDNNQVKLVYHKTDITVKKIANIDQMIDGDFQSDYLDGTATEKGYKINYVWDADDQYFSERVKDLKDKTLIATVAKLSDLGSVVLDRAFTTDDIVLVESENMYYQVADGTATPVTWDAFSENLVEYQKGEGEKNIDITMSTLCQYVEQNTTSLLYEKRPYLGCRQTGSYINSAGALIKGKFASRVFFVGTASVDGATIPISYNHNRDVNNELRVPYSLSIQSTEGLAKIFHIPWLNIIENAELVKVVAKANQNFLHTLRSYNRFQIAGTLFLLKKIERSIPEGSNIKMEMIAL